VGGGGGAGGGAGGGNSSLLASAENPSLRCVQALWGHQSPVTCLSYSSELDLVLSGSVSGLLCLHTVRKGRFVRSIDSMKGLSINIVLATLPGYLVAHSAAEMQLRLFWLNGQELSRARVASRVDTMVVSGSGDVLVCGLASGLLSLRNLASLDELRVYDLSAHGRITCLRFTEGSSLSRSFVCSFVRSFTTD